MVRSFQERKFRSRQWLLAVTALGLLFANPPVTAAEELVVYTVNYPLQYFARRIAGDRARVNFPAPSQVDPAGWMPDRETVGQYQQADLVVLNGAAYAGWVSKVSLPRQRQVDTSAGFKADLIVVSDSARPDQSRVGEHSQAGTASVTWLDFYQAVQQAQAIYVALARRRPADKTEFEKNFAALQKDLMALDLELQRIIAAGTTRRLFASHPVYHYLARRYELAIEDMAWEPGEMPDDQQWLKLRLAQERFPAGLMLWEKQPLSQIAQELDDMGIGVVVFDPCANRPVSGDFLSVMQDNLNNLRRALENTPTVTIPPISNQRGQP